MAQIENLDLDNLSIDDIEDLPEFGAFPAGTYIVDFKLARKTVANHPSVEASMKLIAVQELADATEVEPKEGSETSILYMLDNEFGLGNFKKLAKVVRESQGCGSTVTEIVEAASAGLSAVVTLTAKKDKSDVLRNNIREIVFQ